MPERMPNRMSEYMPERMSEYIYIYNYYYIFIIMPYIPYIYILPNDMSEYVRIVCQGGDHSKYRNWKAIRAWQ